MVFQFIRRNEMQYFRQKILNIICRVEILVGQRESIKKIRFIERWNDHLETDQWMNRGNTHNVHREVKNEGGDVNKIERNDYLVCGT